MKLFFASLYFLFPGVFHAKNTFQKPLVSTTPPIMDSTLCDGFDFPVGDKNGNGTYISKGGKKYTGWKITTNDVSKEEQFAGENWNGFGGTDTDLGQPVYSIASGNVVFAGECPSILGNIILVEHRYAQNGNVISVFAQYACLEEIKVKKGEFISRRQLIGTIGKGKNNSFPAHLHFEIRKQTIQDQTADYLPFENEKTTDWVKENYEDGSAFIRSHRKMMVPFKKDKLVLIHKSAFKCYVYSKGILQQTYEIALGQQPIGPKEKQGDLKVPEGEYSICEKTKGPFSTTNNWSAAYLGTRWLCLTYPNTFDAQNALNKKTITQEQFNKISAATKAGIKPPQNTSLGGGIGLHGWVDEDWSNESDRAQTWGCVSFHNNDLNEFYELITLKTTVIIIP